VDVINFIFNLNMNNNKNNQNLDKTPKGDKKIKKYIIKGMKVDNS
jgi:hypothetical protein